MCDIDWQRLHQATNTDNKPTPGYLFNEIVHNVSHAQPKLVPSVAQYLVDCVDGDHAHVKLKALFVIKNIAYRVPPFAQCMQEHLGSVREAAVFTGPPSALYGDEPYRLVREAAEGALSVLTEGEHYHAQYPEMSQRIVGFGNFLPGEDTVLPDGDVDLGITYRDVASSAVSAVSSGVGAFFGGVKEILVSPFQRRQEEGITLDIDDLEPEGPAGACEEELPPEEEPDPRDEEEYEAAEGTYVPPMLPPPSTESAADARASPSGGPDDWDAIMDWKDGDQDTDEVTPIEELLGLSEGDAGPRGQAPTPNRGTTAPASNSCGRGAESLLHSEAEILEILGMEFGGDGAAGAAPGATGAAAEAAAPTAREAAAPSAGIGAHCDPYAEPPQGFPSTFRHLIAHSVSDEKAASELGGVFSSSGPAPKQGDDDFSVLSNGMLEV